MSQGIRLHPNPNLVPMTVDAVTQGSPTQPGRLAGTKVVATAHRGKGDAFNKVSDALAVTGPRADQSFHLYGYGGDAARHPRSGGGAAKGHGHRTPEATAVAARPRGHG